MLEDETRNVLKSKTVPIKSDWGIMDVLRSSEALIRQEAFSFTNDYYHKYFEGGYCHTMISQYGIQGPSSRYHVSKGTFLPTVTSYVYGHAIGAELQSRLDRVLKVYLEYGIEDVQARVKPRIAFLTFTGSDDAYSCTQKKDTKEESFPTNVGLKALRKTIILSGFFSSFAIFVLFMEKFTKFVGSKLQITKSKKRNQNKARAPEKWQPCQVTQKRLYHVPPNLRGVTHYVNHAHANKGEYFTCANDGAWIPAHVTRMEVKENNHKFCRLM